MGDLIAIVGGRIVDAGIASALITGLVVLAMVATRQPSRRRSIARAGVLASLFTLPLVCARPFVPVDLVEPIRIALGLALARLGASLPRLGGDWYGLATRVLPAALLVAYGLGVLAGLCRLLIGAWGSVWIARNSRPASVETEALYRSMPFAPARSRPRLCVSTRTTRPVLLGSFRPTILIPPELDEPESIQPLKLALLHELAHAETADATFVLVMELASIFWFWLPPLWWIRHQSRLDQEFLADRRAADEFGTSAHYASSLVSIAQNPGRAASESPHRPSALGPGSAIVQRVLMLIRCPFPIEGRPPRWWRLTVLAATTGVLFLATGLTFRLASGRSTVASGPREPRSITLPRIILQPDPSSPASTTLPIRLPASFDLSVEVRGDASQISEIYILGHPLGSPPRPADSMIKDEVRWHRVKLARRARVLTMTVDDGKPTVFSEPSLDEFFSAYSPPGGNTTLRSFHLVW
jgi:beta-lactamase regulating signal transducer with metallopeptidase domain